MLPWDLLDTPIAPLSLTVSNRSALQYTDAIAIFDLLDIHLVHGWLVDPQVRSARNARDTPSHHLHVPSRSCLIRRQHDSMSFCSI